MQEILPDQSKSIKEGGIIPLGEEREASVFKQVTAFAKKHKINLDKPLNQLTIEQINLFFMG